MKETYTASILILVLIMLLVGRRAWKKNSALAKSLIRLTYAGAITVMSSVLALNLPSESVALVMQTIHYVSTEWMLLFLLAFLERYVEGNEGKMAVRIAVFVYSTLCAIQLLLNAVFHHVVYIEYRVARGITYRMFRNKAPWYQFHSYFSFLLAAIVLIVLIAGTIRAKSFYRKKYYPAVIAMLITIALEILCAARDALMDYSLFGYIGMAIFLTYYSVYHVDRELISETLSYVVSEAANGVVCFDAYGKCVYANDVMHQLYKKATDLSYYEGIFRPYKYGEDKEDSKWTDTYVNADGRKYFEVTFRKLLDSKGVYIGCYFLLYDKTDDENSYREMQFETTHDKLTGLYNAFGFRAEVENMMHKYSQDDLYMIAADIKDFKLVNDLYGYDKGDEILKQLAISLEAVLPDYAVCCRQSGDHFYFCIRKDDFVEKTISKGTDGLADILGIDNFRVVVHFGVYPIMRTEENVDVMCDYARMTLYGIKEDYEAKYSYFDEVMLRNVLRTKELVGEFESALQSKQFEMYLQPQVRADGTVVGAEALVRWKHPEFGMISPGIFIPAFENTGMIYKLDQYIWEQAAMTLDKWKNQGKDDYYISVNISTKDFLHIDLYDVFAAITIKYHIDPSKLKLEITESAFMNEPEKQLATIAKLQKYGFNLEIDDFGSGYSSLNTLKDMKANVLKLDMGFLRKTKEEERSKTILKIIVYLAKKLDMEVISEGVEEKEQVEFLTEAGCDLFQGYYFDRPMPVADFEKKYLN